MKRTSILLLVSCFVLILISCSKQEIEMQNIEKQNFNSELNPYDAALSVGAEQFSGVGYFADESTCGADVGADFALQMTGDLDGCLYVFVETYECSPSGTYRESGKEYFIGTYKGEHGTFWTNYKFEAKYEGCEDGFFVGAEIFGRCQHPIVKGSGTGVFEGATGRIDFKDNVVTGELPYRGHIKY